MNPSLSATRVRGGWQLYRCDGKLVGFISTNGLYMETLVTYPLIERTQEYLRKAKR